jgi:hypothetical protein
MKKTTYSSAILTAALFSGASFAGVDNNDDIKYGNGSISASTISSIVISHNEP